MNKTLSPKIILGFAIIWIGCIAVGLAVLTDYENRPGKTGKNPNTWPKESHLIRPTGKPLLVMFVHPHCPCSQASMGELAQILSRCENKVFTTVCFIRPKEFDTDWEKSSLWTEAQRLKVQTYVDIEGEEANRFEAKTSGHTLLYATDGKLIFSGGITASRGHSGDNTGRDTITTFLLENIQKQDHTFVFGCPLQKE